MRSFARRTWGAVTIPQPTRTISESLPVMRRPNRGLAILFVGTWSTRRQAHNLKVVGSNPTPATNFSR